MVPIFLFVTNSIFYAVLMLVKTLYDDHCNGLFNCRKQRIFIAQHALKWNALLSNYTQLSILSKYLLLLVCWGFIAYNIAINIRLNEKKRIENDILNE